MTLPSLVRLIDFFHLFALHLQIKQRVTMWDVGGTRRLWQPIMLMNRGEGNNVKLSPLEGAFTWLTLSTINRVTI